MASRWFRLVRALGLDDHAYGLSFNKSVTLVALLVWASLCAGVMVLSWYGKPLPGPALMAVVVGLGVVVIGAGFGLKGFIASMKRGDNAGS